MMSDPSLLQMYRPFDSNKKGEVKVRNRYKPPGLSTILWTKYVGTGNATQLMVVFLNICNPLYDD